MDVDTQTCPQCGATVASDEQFCPDCGTFLDPMAPTPPPRSGNVISVKSDGTYEEFSLDSAPPTEPDPRSAVTETTGRTTTCPSCGASNPANNRHCQECGARLLQGPLPTAPRPAVQATAGVRAAFAISGLLFLVIVVALLFNIFGGEDPGGAAPPATSTTTTQPQQRQPDVIDVLDTQCTPDGLGSFTCANLTSDSRAEYQVNWEDLPDGESVTIQLTFRQPMTVNQILWRNVEDPTRFKQNYRARGITINSQGALALVPSELQDVPGVQSVPYVAVEANWIEIVVETAWQPQLVEGNIFRELAIDEITVIGYPSTPTTSG